MNKTIAIFIYLILNVLSVEDIYSCTVLYCSMDGIILGGNNEDWEDPLTRMWIYPPEPEKHGWIKFGFGSGFPQGGMNDQGVFWDATAGPYMDMPYSESNKILYHGALMQKVIEECSNVAEAEAILQTYYCQDQYRAQYLIGDALGNSMIDEGDSIIVKDGDYQVLTNFYQSDPDLGGYPCWRYSTASGLLGECTSLSPYFIGMVLASTHQEGKYPTQYSNIYDLKEKLIYLFHYHNYDEFLIIDLMQEMKRGYHSYDIPSLFSNIKLLGPDHGDTLTGTSLDIRWTGHPDCEYRVVCSVHPDMSDPSVTLAYHEVRLSVELLYAFLWPIVLFIPFVRSIRRKQAWILPVLMTVIVMISQCVNEDNPEDPDRVEEYLCTLTGLGSDTTYYWKIEARNGNAGGYTTETVVRSFHTGGTQKR